jgi:hypothetical protein
MKPQITCKTQTQAIGLADSAFCFSKPGKESNNNKFGMFSFVKE